MSNRDKTGAIECPSCEEIFDSKEGLNKDSYANRHLGKAIVYCTNKSNGCPEERKLKDLNDHLIECKFEFINCISREAGCTARVLRGRLADHLANECHFRPEQCKFCGDTFPVGDLPVSCKMQCLYFCRYCIYSG